MLCPGIAMNSVWLKNRFPMREWLVWLETRHWPEHKKGVSSYSQGDDKSLKGNVH